MLAGPRPAADAPRVEWQRAARRARVQRAPGQAARERGAARAGHLPAARVLQPLRHVDPKMVRRACRGRARARRRAAGASGGSLGRRLRAPCNPHAAPPPQVPRAPLAPAQARLLRAEGVHCVGAGRVGGAEEAAQRVAAGAGGGGDRVAGAHGSREPRHALGQAAPPRLDQDDGRDLQLAVRRGADRVRHPGRAAPARGDQAAGQGGAEALGEGQAHQHEAAALARCCRARPGAARCGRARAWGRARGRGLF